MGCILLPRLGENAAMVRRMKISFLIATPCALLLAGCVSATHEQIERSVREQSERIEAESKATRSAAEKQEAEAAAFRDAYIAKNPLLSDMDKQAVREKRPIVGLTPEEAFYIVGPMFKSAETGGIGGEWSVWKTGRTSPRLELYFRNNRLVRWIEY